MDPILIPTLLNVLDLLALRSGPVSLEDLNVMRQVTGRRFDAIGRVVEKLGVAHREGLLLVPNPELARFVKCWEIADLECLNSIFRRYAPYDNFLQLLKAERCIPVPPREDSTAKHRIGEELKRRARLTFVAVDTFKWWGMAVGQVYISHIGDGNIYWGGEEPELATFESRLLQHYKRIHSSDGYVNVGQLADLVCRDLGIAFIRFEKAFEQLYRQRRDRYVISTSLLRIPSRRSPVQTIMPRTRARQLADSLRPGKAIEWTEKRFIEDGVFVSGHSVKLVKVRLEDVND